MVALLDCRVWDASRTLGRGRGEENRCKMLVGYLDSNKPRVIAIVKQGKFVWSNQMGIAHNGSTGICTHQICKSDDSDVITQIAVKSDCFVAAHTKKRVGPGFQNHCAAHHHGL